jgi:hypothetical protein
MVVVLAACHSATTPQATQAITPQAITPQEITPPAGTDAGAPKQPEIPDATCIAPDATLVDVRYADGVLVACYAQDKVDECWRFDTAKSSWSFGMRRPHVDESPSETVTVTATSARVCTSEGSDCKTVPLSGIVTAPDETLAGSTNLDRSIVAVWGSGPVHVFDATGKRLSTIRPWPTPMTGGQGPSFFREAHVLGSTIEVRIADTPVSAAIRLYDTRGKKIADVFGGVPMEDFHPPLALGNSRYGFTSIDAPRTLVIVDVTTGKQLGSYRLPGPVLVWTLLLRTPDDNVIGAVGPNAVRIDLVAKKLTSVAAPICR